MTERERFSLASALEAADEDRVAEWVGEFLADHGSDNATLAAALAEQPQYWLGPIRLPVNDLVQLAGPSEEEVCPVEPDEWDEDVETMQESLEEGWQPPPLLVEFGDGELFVQDGNHWYDALVDAGSSHVWAFVWFDDTDERARFCADRPDIDDGRSAPSRMVDLSFSFFAAIRRPRGGVHPRSRPLGARRGRELRPER